MTSGTVSSLFVLLLSCSPALAQSQTANAQFNQVLNINGDMKINSFTFPDRSRVETFSQKQQQLIVNQNTPPIPPNQVTGSTGQPFVALMAQSMSINTNNASSLVGGQIELAMDPQMLQNAAVNPDNTFVAKLSPDRQTWMIQETMRSVNITDKTVRMVKRQNLDGEYMALGRQTIETNAFLTGFGTDPSTQVAVQGTGLQENEFQDGFRMSVRATQPMTMNVDVKQGVDSGQLTALQGQQSVNNFRYSVVTNLAGVQPNLNRQVTVVQMPLNAARIQSMMQSAGIQQGGQVQLSVAQRGILQNPGGATGQLTGPTTPQRRGREAFREDIVARQVQGATGQTGTGQTGTGQTTTGQTGTGQTGTGQTGTGQTTTGQTGTGQTTTGQTGTGQTTNGQTGTGTTGTTGTGTNQQGTGTTNNNPAATQLLLAPTFTPIQAQLVLDPVNMRVAFPVAAVDGEYIITMQTGAGGATGQQPQAQGQAPPQPQAGTQPTAGQQPQGQTPPTAEPQGQRGNGTAPAGEKPREKRQSSSNKAPLGSVFIQMDWINQMVELDQWGGQVAITKMMDEYVKAGGNSNGTKTN